MVNILKLKEIIEAASCQVMIHVRFDNGFTMFIDAGRRLYETRAEDGASFVGHDSVEKALESIKRFPSYIEEAALAGVKDVGYNKPGDMEPMAESVKMVNPDTGALEDILEEQKKYIIQQGEIRDNSIEAKIKLVNRLRVMSPSEIEELYLFCKDNED